MAWTVAKATKLIADVANEKQFLSRFIKNALINQSHKNWQHRIYSQQQLERRALIALKAAKRKAGLAEIWLRKQKVNVSSIVIKNDPPVVIKPAKIQSFEEQHRNYIKSKQWQKLKQLYRSDKNRKQECWRCNVTEIEKPHDFHHIHYRTFKCETLDDIIPLCRDCHNHIHNIHKAQTSKTIEQITIAEIPLLKISNDTSHKL